MNQQAESFLEYRNLLFSIAYNMLGQVEAAQDIVQDTFLVWMEIDTESIRHPKAFLVKIVTNTCINYLHSGRVNREKYIGVWLPEPLQDRAADAAHERIESYHALSIGLMVLLEKLTPRERAIFLLKEIFAYDYYELAELFDITADNARQILRRAKDHLGQDSRRFRVDIKVHEKILHNFLRAVTEGALDDLIGLLKEDIVLMAEGGGKPVEINGQRLSATARPIHGRKNVGHLVSTIMGKFFRYIPGLHWQIIVVNGLPSILSSVDGVPFGLVSIESDGHQISNIYIQTNPDKLRHFNSHE
jgi:RNA polymerase sigma-70 factor (ECF subfamily)